MFRFFTTIANSAEWTAEKAVKFLRMFSGPLCIVKIGLFSKVNDVGQYSYQVVCWRADRHEEFDDLRKCGYFPMEIFQTKLYCMTEMTMKIVGGYQIDNGPLKLT